MLKLRPLVPTCVAHSFSHGSGRLAVIDRRYSYRSRPNWSQRSVNHADSNRCLLPADVLTPAVAGNGAFCEVNPISVNLTGQGTSLHSGYGSEAAMLQAALSLPHWSTDLPIHRRSRNCDVGDEQFCGSNQLATGRITFSRGINAQGRGAGSSPLH
jgi:hypothetical protein